MGYLQNNDIQNQPSRSNKDYMSSSRSELINHLKTEVKKNPGNKISDFFSRSLWSWIYHYFKSRFGRKFPYLRYTGTDTGIYEADQTTICITSDWATDTADSFAIASRMKNENPDFTIHMGDTYYVGAPPEIHSNFVDDGSPWYRGSKGSFALLGNHEMYARGDAFFECLLPTLGLRDANGLYTGQKAGYFCLQNDYWRIIGLDTGYHSTGKPLLEFLPWFAPDCRLPDAIMEWLKDELKIGNPQDKRGLLFLTHHQYITAFRKESEYQKAASQLASLIGKERKVLWLWGHEHKLSYYEKAQIKDGITAYGRCIGNGGTAAEIEHKSFSFSEKRNGFSKLVAVDTREQKIVGGVALGYNSYVTIKLKGEELSLAYADHENLLLTENWKADISTGEISGKITVQQECSIRRVDGKTWEDAVL